MRTDPDAARSVFDEALELRDLLKFEFFFPAIDAFVGEVRHELLRRNSSWRSLLKSGDVGALLHGFDPKMAPLVLRPFFESYRIIAEVIERDTYVSQLDEKTIKKDAMSLGGQYLRQQAIASPESVSNPLFESALSLAKYRNLLEGSPTSISNRLEFVATMRLLCDQVAELATTPG